MNILETLKVVLANTFVMYTHAHIAHWNIEGPDFHDKHGFLGDLYSELWEAVDAIAEHMRTSGFYAPGTMTDLVEPTTIVDADPGRAWEIIRQRLVGENHAVEEALEAAFQAAEEESDQGLANFLAGRIETHEKHGWMLRVSR